MSGSGPVGRALRGKRIVVTGGAQGRGESTVRAFAREGAAVVSMDLKEDAGVAAAERISREAGAEVSFVGVDVSDRGQVFASMVWSSRSVTRCRSGRDGSRSVRSRYGSTRYRRRRYRTR